MWKILVIDDEPDRTEQIADWFSSIGFDVTRAHSGKEGLRRARRIHPDVILLDIWMPPPMDGHEVLLRLRRDPDMVKIPVVVWSIKADELHGLQDLLRTGLRDGADYVVAKKWGLPALEEVVRKLLAPPEQLLSVKAGVNELKLGEGCIEVWVNDVHKSLAPLEARVLAYLNDRRGQPCNVREIADNVWRGGPTVGDENNVRRVIERLRRRIEPDRKNPIFIVTVKGFGYRLVEGD